MPQAVVLAISYRCEGTEGSARMRLTFDSWPQINVEKEWPEIQKKLQKLRMRNKLENYTIHYFHSPSEHLELRTPVLQTCRSGLIRIRTKS